MTNLERFEKEELENWQRVIEGDSSVDCQDIEPLVRAFEAAMDELKANVRLIASAPDLLEACKMMLGAWEELNDEFNMGDCEATVTAREAIAKAEWRMK